MAEDREREGNWRREGCFRGWDRVLGDVKEGESDWVGGEGSQKNLTVQLQFHFEKTLFKYFFFFCPVLRSNKIYIVRNHLIDNI